MRKGGAVSIHRIGDARRCVANPRSGLLQVINLQDHHVAAVAAALLQQSAGRGARFFR